MEQRGETNHRLALLCLVVGLGVLLWIVPVPSGDLRLGGRISPTPPVALSNPDGVVVSSPARRVTGVPIENLFQLTPGLYSGGGPEGDQAFATLARLGIRTIISVDGTPPDVALARRYGLRYVHVPIGYEGVRSDRLPQLLKAVRELPGPVLVHCHHGRHRGPAAAAVCAVGVAGWTRSQALAWLGQAGTDPAYRGLHRDVAQLPLPTVAETSALAPIFPEQVVQQGVVETMVEMDRALDRLKLAARRDWSMIDDRGRTPVEAALGLLEGYRELMRDSQIESRGGAFLGLLQQATEQASELHAHLEAAASPGGSRDGTLLEIWGRVQADCRACHQRFRDNVLPH